MQSGYSNDLELGKLMKMAEEVMQGLQIQDLSRGVRQQYVEVFHSSDPYAPGSPFNL